MQEPLLLYSALPHGMGHTWANVFARFSYPSAFARCLFVRRMVRRLPGLFPTDGANACRFRRSPGAHGLDRHRRPCRRFGRLGYRELSHPLDRARRHPAVFWNHHATAAHAAAAGAIGAGRRIAALAPISSVGRACRQRSSFSCGERVTRAALVKRQKKSCGR